MSDDKIARVGVISPSEATMKVGEKKTFTVTGDTIRTAYAANGKLSIEATTQTSTSVTVIAMTEGEDTLNIIFVNDGTASVPIHIVSESSGDGGSGGGGSTTVPVTGIEVDAWSVDLEVGQTRQMVASVVPSNATNQTINWWSQNQSVATVSQGGLITAKSEGYSLVTATTDDGGHSYNVHVNVSASSSGGGGSTTVPVTGVSLNKSSTSLTVGKTEILTATVTPTNATNKTVTWSSNNTAVATVDNGTITAKAKGSATITVRTSDGNKTATCAVTVTDATTPTPTPPTNNAPTISFVLVSNETSSGGYTLSYTATDPNGDTLTHKLKLDAGGYSVISPTKSGTSYTFNGSGLSVGTHTGQIQVSDGSLTATSEVFNITIRAQATGVKAQLKEAKDIYDEKHTALKTTINSVISDGEFNEATEKSQLDQAFSAYNSALAQFKKMAQKAIDFIGDAKKDSAIDESKVYTNAQIKVVSDSITQRVDRVEEKQTSVDGKVSALETWKSSAEQKITADAIINTVSSTITQAKNEAINEANSNTTNALQGYPTTTQMNSAIQQTADSINATVSSNYTDLNGKIQSANAAITQTAESIQSSISQQYYNKGEIEEKGYQTSSQVQQAVNSVKFSFQESGGYNLLKNSKWDAKKEQWTFTNDSYVSVIEDAVAGTNYLRCQTANGATHGCSQTIKVEKDNTYVASAKVDFDNGAIAVLRVQVNGSTYYAKTNQASQYRNKVLFVSFPVTTSGDAVITLYTDSSSTTGKYARFRYSQVELGSEFSPWSPNPYEIYGGVATIDKDKVRIQHDNGSYSQMAVSGFKRFDSGTGRDYHYLSSNGVINVSNGTPVTVTLPSEFKGKDFKVTLSIFKVNIPSGVGWNGIYDIDSYTSNVDRSTAKFTVEAMVKSVNGQYGTVDISYVVIA